MNVSKHKKTIHLTVIIVIILIFPAIILLDKTELFANFIWADEPFHTFVESIGALFSIIIAIVINIRDHDIYKNKVGLLALGFLSMGVLNAFHSVASPGVAFVFLHSIAVLFGGFFFVLIIFPKLSEKRIAAEQIIWLAVFLVLIGIVSLAFPNILPAMVYNNKFTNTAFVINLIGGFLFLIASIRLFIDYYQSPHTEIFLFAVLSLLFSISGFAFNQSSLWDSGWWIWHILQLSAFIIAFVIVALQYVSDTKQMRNTQSQLKVTNQQLLTNNQQLLASEQQLRASNQQLETQTEELTRMATVVKDSNDAITIQDLEGNITAWNTRAEKMYGYTDKEAFKMNIIELIPDEYKSEALNLINQLKKDELVESLETKRKTKDDKILDVWMVVTKLVDDKGKLTGLVSTERDITERKQKEEKLKALNQQLERNEKSLIESNNELQQFAYIASHDLQEPLRMVASYTQLLERKYNDILDDKAKKYIFYATDGAKRMQSLINDLLHFSRVTTKGGEFVNIDTNQILQKAKKNLEVVIKEKKAEIIADKLPEIFADENQMISVFQNLLSNAIKFCIKDKKPIIHISVKKEKNNWLFSIKDNGIGIDKEFSEKVFVIFQRLHTKDIYDGTGIGLSVTKKIIERHKGKLWFKSEINVGTTFFINLPLK